MCRRTESQILEQITGDSSVLDAVRLEMLPRQAFVSYHHADNAASMNGILTLAEDISQEFGLITGQELKLRTDNDILQWGDEWRMALEAEIEQASFFIPFITPRFFTRPECRREFDQFLSLAQDLGRKDLVMPIIWATVQDLTAENPDPLVAKVHGTKYKDWSKLRLVDRSSAAYKSGVNDLATSIQVRIEQLADLAPLDIPVRRAQGAPVAASGVDDGPGYLEILAENEHSQNELTPSLEAISTTLRDLNAVTTSFVPMIDRTNKQGLTSKKIVFINEYARSIAPLIDRLETEVSDYRTHLEGVDRINMVLLSHGTSEPNRVASRDLAKSLIEASMHGFHFIDQLENLSESVSEVENVTRSMRPPTRKLRAALLSLRDTRPVLQRWDEGARRLLGELNDLGGD